MYVTETSNGVRTADEIITISVPWIILAILIYLLQKRRVRFREISIKYSNEEFQEAIKRTADKYEL